METQLRPLSLGGILAHTAQLYRSNFLLFAGIAAVYAGTPLALGLAQVVLQEALRTAHLGGWIPWLNVAVAGVQWLLIFLSSGLAVAANNRAVAWAYLDEPATVRSAYANVLRHPARYLWLVTIITFVQLAPIALCYGGFAATAFFWYRPLVHAGHGQAGEEATLIFGLITLAVAVLALLSVIYAVWIGLRYSLAVPACVVEDSSARTALRRSVWLSRGSRGRILVFSLLCMGIQFGVSAAGQIFFVWSALRHQGEVPLWEQVAQLLVAFCTSTLLHPIYATGTTLFYYDQHWRKDGFDAKERLQTGSAE